MIFNGRQILVEHFQVTTAVSGIGVAVVSVTVVQGVVAAMAGWQAVRAVDSGQIFETTCSLWRPEDPQLNWV